MKTNNGSACDLSTNLRLLTILRITHSLFCL